MSQQSFYELGLKDLEPVIRDLHLYMNSSEDTELPSSFMQWLSSAYDNEHLLQSGLKSKLDYIRKLGEEAQAQNDVLADLVMALFSLQKNISLLEVGVDPVSLLGTKKAMRELVSEELERVARKGAHFCLVLVCITNENGALSVSVNDESYRQALRLTADQIHKCMRTFDDGFRVNDREFVLSLKQTTVTGGTAAIERLRELLDKSEPSFRDAEQNVLKLEYAYCASAPVPGDDLDDLIKNMRSDLLKYNDGIGAVVEYHEVSPLQRLIEEEN